MDILYNPTKYNLDENVLIEKAIAFLVDEYRKTGHNSKPVIFHCTRVASLLVQLNYDANTIAAAYLHDLIEDTEVTYEQIEREFGGKIANIVKLVSFDPSIIDKREQYMEMFSNIIEAEENVIALKAADILDNSTYYSCANNNNVRAILMEKLEGFIEICNQKIPKAPITQALITKYQMLRGRCIVEGRDEDGPYIEKRFFKDLNDSFFCKLVTECNTLAELKEKGFVYAPSIIEIDEGEYAKKMEGYFFYRMKKIEGETPESTVENWSMLGKITAELHNSSAHAGLLKLDFVIQDYTKDFAYSYSDYLNKRNNSKRAVIHTDIGMHNAILKGDGSMSLIDWDDVGYGSIYVDLGAPLLCCFIDQDEFQADKCKAFYEEYSKVSNEKSIDPEMIYITGMIFLIEYKKYNSGNQEKLIYAKKHKSEIIATLTAAFQ